MRIDVYIKGIDGHELFIDVTGLCITAKSNRKGELAHATKADVSRMTAIQNRHPDPMARSERPVFAKRAQEKLLRYAPLVDIASLQVEQGLRRAAPVFRTVGFSRCGSLSKGAFQVVDWIANQYAKADALYNDRFDSRSTHEVRAEFRSDMLDRLACKIASGTANIMRAAGHYRGVCRFSGGGQSHHRA